MNLIRFLFRNARGMTVITGLAAFLSGVCNAGLLALVNRVLDGAGSPGAAMVWCFIGLGLGKLTMNLISQAVLARIAQGAVARLRQGLAQKILAVPLRHLEELGTPRLMAALTEDVLTVAESLPMIPNFAVNIATLCGGAVYLCLH